MPESGARILSLTLICDDILIPWRPALRRGHRMGVVESAGWSYRGPASPAISLVVANWICS